MHAPRAKEDIVLRQQHSEQTCYVGDGQTREKALKAVRIEHGQSLWAVNAVPSRTHPSIRTSTAENQHHRRGYKLSVRGPIYDVGVLVVAETPHNRVTERGTQVHIMPHWQHHYQRTGRVPAT